jgi:predicted phage tail protein
MSDCTIFSRSILSKSKHHGFRSVRGAAALATIFFNHGRTALVDFFKDNGMRINTALFEHLLKIDKRRIKKTNKNKEHQEIRKQRKELNRKKSIKVQLDITDYDAGAFNS